MPLFSRSSNQPTQTIYFVKTDDAQVASAPSPQTHQVPDAPQNRFQINQRCVYERRLPGEAYMTAHVERLQPGIYEDDPNMSMSASRKHPPEKPVPEQSRDGKSATPAVRKLQSTTQGPNPGISRDLSKSLRKKAHVDSSMRKEYELSGRTRPLSYQQIGELKEGRWPSSPSSTGGDSHVAKLPDTVYFLAIGFVLHPSDSLHHRFKSARIRMTVDFADWTDPRIRRPKIIKYAPHLIYGVVSQETLNWTFNLTGSLGISQGPASASITPSRGFSETAVLSKMMKIQGSTRTTPNGVEDGELLWSLEENPIQKSGLPREFTFVVLIQIPKGEEDNIDFRLEVEPVIDTWYGSYPRFWQRRKCYSPLYKAPLDFRERIGQRFLSSTEGSGTTGPGKATDYNFATMEADLDDLVQLPGNTYSVKEGISAKSSIDP